MLSHKRYFANVRRILLASHAPVMVMTLVVPTTDEFDGVAEMTARVTPLFPATVRGVGTTPVALTYCNVSLTPISNLSSVTP